MAQENRKSTESGWNKNHARLNLTTYEQFKRLFSNITVEPLMLCYHLPNVAQSLSMQNVNLEKACRVDLAFNSSVCDALIQHNASGYSPTEEIAVQKLVAASMVVKNVIQSVLPTIILLFIGSWTDRYCRRKPAILLPIAAEVITTLCFGLSFYYFYELSLVYTILSESVPPSLVGGWFTMTVGVFSYITANSGETNRTLRIGIVNMFTNVSITIGIALSGIMYSKMGTYGVLGTTLAMYFIGFIYGTLRIKDKPRKLSPVEKKKSFLKDFFDPKHVMETIQVTFKEGERNRKKRVCMIMILVMVIVGPIHGELNILYLFVRYKFKWDEIDYSIYSTFNFIVHIVGTLFSLMFFSKYLKFDDALVGVISNLSKIVSCFVYAFAPTPMVFYVGAIAEMFNGTSFMAMRSIISKLVPQNELGKIFSIFALSEALMPLIYGPMYSFVYRNTINIFPGAFFLVGGFLNIPSVLIFMWLYMEHKRDECELKLNAKQAEILLKEKEEIILATSEML